MTTFETGATSHAVNELILFTGTTRELVELRDKTYRLMIQENTSNPFSFNRLLHTSIMWYKHEIGNIHISCKDEKEYCELYANDFQNWKQENGY